MKIYYMRDNHTFISLGMDVEIACERVTEAFEEGYSHGMLCSHETDLDNVHAKGKLLPFLVEVRKYYRRMTYNQIGAGI